MKKNKKIFFIGIIALLGGITAYVMTSNPENKISKEINKSEAVKKEDPYGNIQKDKIDKVKTAKKVVDEVLSASEKELELKTTEANKAINDIGDETPELKAIQNAFRGIIEVANNPTIDHLQTARTNIANLSDSTFSNFLEKQFEDKLITIVSNKTNKNKEDIKKEFHPLTPEQVKEKEEAKVKAEKEAKEKSEKEAKEKAERDRIEKEKAEQTAKEQAVEQEQANQNQAENNSNYVPPVDNGNNQNYTPPIENGEGNHYTPSQNNNETQNNGDMSLKDPNRPLPEPSEENGWGTTGQDLGEWDSPSVW